MPKETSVIFYNKLKYDYHFIIRKLWKEFEREFICLGENTKKHKLFSVSTTKEVTRIYKNGRK